MESNTGDIHHSPRQLSFPNFPQATFLLQGLGKHPSRHFAYLVYVSHPKNVRQSSHLTEQLCSGLLINKNVRTTKTHGKA